MIVSVLNERALSAQSSFVAIVYGWLHTACGDGRPRIPSPPRVSGCASSAADRGCSPVQSHLCPPARLSSGSVRTARVFPVSG